MQLRLYSLGILTLLCLGAVQAFAGSEPEQGVVTTSTSVASAEQGEAFALTVRVEGLRNLDGVVQFSLYNENGSIPDEKFKKYYRQVQGTITNNSSAVTFVDLPIATYAVSIHHDENVDGTINRGFILPVEGVGFTNYSRIGPMNRPNFSGASFELKADMETSVSVIYF